METPEVVLTQDDTPGSVLTQEVLHAPPGIKEAREAAEVEYEEEPVDLLWAMEFVVSRDKKWDRTELQRQCRKWLQDNRSGFMGKMADLKGKVKAAETTEAVPCAVCAARVEEESRLDEGTARLIAVGEALLKEWKDA